jgi:2-(1,2-epoxy-1,2-dihydrophenyl)acetyl-CoA isomerase
MSYSDLLFDVTGEVATVTLNRPDKLNALNRNLQQEILDVCYEVKHNDGIRAVVWTGAGRGFCSGADVTGPMPAHAPPPTWQLPMY